MRIVHVVGYLPSKHVRVDARVGVQDGVLRVLERRKWTVNGHASELEGAIMAKQELGIKAANNLS